MKDFYKFNTREQTLGYMVQEMYKKYTEDPTGETIDMIVRLARASGNYSVWRAGFTSCPRVHKELKLDEVYNMANVQAQRYLRVVESAPESAKDLLSTIQAHPYAWKYT
jgi:hypothetical protein